MFAGFAGSNTLEEAQILMVGGCAVDILTPLVKMHGVKEQDAKASAREVGYINNNNNNKTLFIHRQIRDCCPVHGCVHGILRISCFQSGYV